MRVVGVRGAPRHVVGVHVGVTGAARKYAHVGAKGDLWLAIFKANSAKIVRVAQFSFENGLRYLRANPPRPRLR